MTRWILSAVTLILLVGCGPSHQLGSEEIEELMSGAIASGVHLKDDYVFTRTYSDDGTFFQIRSGQSEPEGGSWKVLGRRLCVTWDNADEAFCRTVHHDYRGDYWKILKKRNGNKVRIVTYEEIIDGRSGADRRERVGGARYLGLWLLSGSGLMTLGGLGVLALFGYTRLRKDLDHPHSLGNRVRRWRVLRVGDTRVHYKALQTLSPKALGDWIQAASDANEWVFVAWGYEALLEVVPPQQAFDQFWAAIEHHNDTVLVRGLGVVKHVTVAAQLEPYAQQTPRALQFLAEAWLAEARATQKTDKSRFDRARAEGLLLMKPLQEQLEAQKSASSSPDRNLYRVGPTVEALLYLKFIQPVRTSSSYSSGG